MMGNNRKRSRGKGGRGAGAEGRSVERGGEGRPITRVEGPSRSAAVLGMFTLTVGSATTGIGGWMRKRKCARVLTMQEYNQRMGTDDGARRSKASKTWRCGHGGRDIALMRKTSR